MNERHEYEREVFDEMLRDPKSLPSLMVKFLREMEVDGETVLHEVVSRRFIERAVFEMQRMVDDHYENLEDHYRSLTKRASRDVIEGKEILSRAATVAEMLTAKIKRAEEMFDLARLLLGGLPPPDWRARSEKFMTWLGELCGAETAADLVALFETEGFAIVPLRADSLVAGNLGCEPSGARIGDATARAVFATMVEETRIRSEHLAP